MIKKKLPYAYENNSNFFQIYVDVDHVKNIINMLSNDPLNISSHYDDILENDLNKYGINNLVNLKQSKKYVKNNSCTSANDNWSLVNVYSFDILVEEAKELYDLLVGIINNDGKAIYKGLNIYIEKQKTINKLENELLDKLDSISDIENEVEKMSELKYYAKALKNAKDNNMNKYYKMLYEFIDLGFLLKHGGEEKTQKK